jgi:hypothetical protein
VWRADLLVLVLSLAIVALVSWPAPSADLAWPLLPSNRAAP